MSDGEPDFISEAAINLGLGGSDPRLLIHFVEIEPAYICSHCLFKFNPSTSILLTLPFNAESN